MATPKSDGEARGTQLRVVVMGVASAGKSTVADALADQLDTVYLDADDFHPPANVEKMAAGRPLVDADRWAWLAALRQELRQHTRVVLACSTLRRSHRDMLRGAGGVHFVFLDLDEASATARAKDRDGHFMQAEMVASQFEALERPELDETDISTIDATTELAEVVAAALQAVAVGVRQPEPTLSDGAVDRSITDAELREHVRQLAKTVLDRDARRVLLVPPDHTRLFSRAGEIAAIMRAELVAQGCEVGVLPALGTHARMTAEDADLLFGGHITAAELLWHNWRTGLRPIGEIGADEVSVTSGDRYCEPVEIAVSEHLFNDWDLVVSIGQVVPHEVIGMANFTKNLVIGLGGPAVIHRSHFIGAVCDMESIMGQTQSPVRDIVDTAFDRYVAPLIDVLWVLTVIEDVGGETALRGLFAGEGTTSQSGGAAYRSAAALAQAVNINVVDEPFARVACWLDEREFKSTWLGNKAVYRTRMAIADGGELVVLAPGVERFGEDDQIDSLIRRHGYRGTPAALTGIDVDPELAVNLSAAAHLIHGSSEGRFRIVYCTDPSTGGLTKDEVERAGFDWRSLPHELMLLGVDASTLSGPRTDTVGDGFSFIANPALGLWASTTA